MKVLRSYDLQADLGFGITTVLTAFAPSGRKLWTEGYAEAAIVQHGDDLPDTYSGEWYYRVRRCQWCDNILTQDTDTGELDQPECTRC